VRDELNAVIDLSQGIAPIADVEDGSNLTLDPDLDSFYSQDLVTVKLPTLAVRRSRQSAIIASSRPICSAPFVPGATPAPPSSCRGSTPRR